MTIRRAIPNDIPRIAALHAASWRDAYRGILSDAYLDTQVDAERLEVWRARCGDDVSAWPLILLAEAETSDASAEAPLVGFICMVPDEHPEWGALIDNLHVRPGFKAQGIGRRLLAEAATALGERAAQHPVYLWVFADNHGARAFYERLGGAARENERYCAPDGTEAMTIRYQWSRLAMLV